MKKQEAGFLNNTLVKILNGMALGLMASLVTGVILKQIGTYLNIQELIMFGQVAQYMMGPAIGAGVALSLEAPPLGVFASVVCGMLGAGTIKYGGSSYILASGEPVGSLAASVAGALASKAVFGKTKCDIIVVPGITIIAGGVISIFASPYISRFMMLIGNIINKSTNLNPLPMGILVALIMGIIITSPISSAAVAISLGLSGLSAGAATIGCACHMVGFAVAGYKDNGFNGLISHGLGTSKLQMANSIKNPLILVPPMAASVILGGVGAAIFKMENNKIGAGMGTSGLVGQFTTFEVMGEKSLIPMLLLHFIFPAVIALLVSGIMRKTGLIKQGDMKI
ncbi:Predicted membrane protein, putative toxin regulator [Sebaldella termitidis]|uniref:PfoR protein n=1 Tax=Sebaldella termitidis (strain ATCC 33386 / NCTC 11300) TaxID=526218 RepID=D1ARE5_SEBTE|nr:PfoR protein [Sebaldella termitidis ATCC 33386]SUI25773.1 Predicted membrane protein, putative toxin regulator [Sebaldella termitidis]